MNIPEPSKAYLWDASAILRIIFKDGQGHKEAEAVYHSLKSLNYIAEHSVYEILGVIKRKWNHKEIVDDAYFRCILFTYQTRREFKVKDLELDDSNLLIEARKIVIRYKIDIIDAYMILEIKKGSISFFGGDSGPFLLTADNELYQAALSEGIKAINLNDFCKNNK